nr:MAG TPA: hypothetical protein [Caudoviricetes sp.]
MRRRQTVFSSFYQLFFFEFRIIFINCLARGG